VDSGLDLLHHIQKTPPNQPPQTHKRQTITKSKTTIIQYY